MDAYTVTATAMAPFLLLLIGLTVTVLIDPYISRRQRSVLLLIVCFSACIVLRDGLGYLLEVQIINPVARTWNSIVGYTFRPIILLLFLYVIEGNRKVWHFWVLIGVNAAIHLTALFDPAVCFGFQDNVFHRGPLGYTSHVVSGILLAYLLFRTIREYSRVKRAEMWIPIGNALLIVVTVILDSVAFVYSEGVLSFTTVAIVCCTLFYYIWLHLQFVRQHEQALFAEQRIQIMRTQIQPHFLYNTIATFRALCKKDPEKAATVAEKFGSYLRQNLDTLDTEGLIPFEKELEHTRLYADIEMVRFENVHVIYDMEDLDFGVPPLTVQPLVENAIRHGVRAREDGVVRVRSYAEGGWHVVSIEDNGVGFNTDMLAESGEEHIGIRNVQERVASMCGGTLTVNSRIGEGTTVTIRIPKGGAK